MILCQFTAFWLWFMSALILHGTFCGFSREFTWVLELVSQDKSWPRKLCVDMILPYNSDSYDSSNINILVSDFQSQPKRQTSRETRIMAALSCLNSRLFMSLHALVDESPPLKHGVTNWRGQPIQRGLDQSERLFCWDPTALGLAFIILYPFTLNKDIAFWKGICSVHAVYSIVEYPTLTPLFMREDHSCCQRGLMLWEQSSDSAVSTLQIHSGTSSIASKGLVRK